MRVGVLLLAALLAPLGSAYLNAAPRRSIADFDEVAARTKVILKLPRFPESSDEVSRESDTALRDLESALAAIETQSRPDFANIVGALDAARWKAQTTASVLSFISQMSPDAAVRDAAGPAVTRLAGALALIESRPRIWAQLVRIQPRRDSLRDEDRRLFDETLRDFRRAGAALKPEAAEQIARRREELAKLTQTFDSNIAGAKANVVFTRAELAGLPESFLRDPRIASEGDRFTVAADSIWQFNTIEDNATLEETRRRVQVAHDSVARDSNVPVLNRMLTIRSEIAAMRGYKSWADFQIELQMAGTADNAMKFVQELADGLTPKFKAELAEMRAMKIADTGKPDATLSVWDWRFYANRIKCERFSVDTQALRAFFPFEKVRDGMMNIYAQLFGIRFEEIEAPQKFGGDAQWFAVSDVANGTPLGILYLDVFARDGKPQLGGTSEIAGGRLLENGYYSRPVEALVLNFSPANKKEPALLGHDEVEVLFHEFGHALHGILTRAKYSHFSGTNVPRDFVEAPSQMFQNWIWDKKVLDTFAADYRDPNRRIPADVIEKMNAARVANAGMFYRRQCAFAAMDLALHGPRKAGEPIDCAAKSNAIIAQYFLPVDGTTAMVASFRGMDGYDAAYYGYAWSEAIAADMATVFQKAPRGFLDPETGMRLRREIYEVGGTRDVNDSVGRFLGRKSTPAAFLERIGLRR